MVTGKNSSPETTCRVCGLWWFFWFRLSNFRIVIWCGFDHASSLICGNKMPTRCNRGFYCRSYCLLNIFRSPLCPSSGAQEYYTVVAAYGISCCGFQVAGLVWSWGLCVRFAGCCISYCFTLRTLPDISRTRRKRVAAWNIHIVPFFPPGISATIHLRAW